MLQVYLILFCIGVIIWFSSFIMLLFDKKLESGDKTIWFVILIILPVISSIIYFFSRSKRSKGIESTSYNANLSYMANVDNKKKKQDRLQTVLGFIAILWGAPGVINLLLYGLPEASSIYTTGRQSGMIFLSLLFIIGLVTVIKKNKALALFSVLALFVIALIIPIVTMKTVNSLKQIPYAKKSRYYRKVRKIKVGMTKSQIRKLMGEPYMTLGYSDTWNPLGNKNPSLILVYYSRDGKAVEADWVDLGSRKKFEILD